MLSKKAQSLKPSPTLAIAAKAKELATQGHSVISLSVGEPDWDTFDSIKQAGIQALQKGQTKYAPSNGLPALREVIAKITSEEMNQNFTANQVTVSTGAKFILYSALQMLLDPGDEVIIPSPYWVSYPTMVELSDGVPVIVRTSENNRFRLTAQDLEKAITPKTKVLLLNSPSNPSGEVLQKEDLKGIADVLKKHPRIIVLSDDIYNRLVFDGSKVAPHVLHVAPELKDRCVLVNGASKTFSMTGWRIGWAVGPQAVISAMSNYQSQTVSCASPFTQVATIEGLKNAWKDVENSLVLLRARRDHFVRLLNEIPGWKAQAPTGAFYVWADIRGLMGKTWKDKKIDGSKAVAEALLDSQKVAVVPGSESGVEGFLRLSYALDEKDLSEATRRISEFTKELRPGLA